MINTVKIVSLNVNGLRTDNVRRRKIFNYLHHLKAHVVLLQEVHSDTEVEKFWRSEWGGEIYFLHGSSNARGAAILLKRNFPFKTLQSINDGDGRVVAISIDMLDRQYTIANIYAPNTDDKQFFINAFAMLEQLGNDLAIVAGDFNTVLNVKLDIKGGKGCSNVKTREFLNEALLQKDMVDVWRLQHGEEFRSTFVRKRPVLLMERIDFFIVSSALQQNIIKTDILPMFASDHSPVLIELCPAPCKPGKGYWKLNNSLLSDETLCQQIPKVILEVFTNLNSMDYFLQWECVKMAIRDTILRRSVQISKSKNNKIEVLDRKLSQLIGQRDNESVDILLATRERQIEAISAELDSLRQQRTLGAMLRSKTDWTEFSEKSSSYFFQ